MYYIIRVCKWALHCKAHVYKVCTLFLQCLILNNVWNNNGLIQNIDRGNAWQANKLNVLVVIYYVTEEREKLHSFRNKLKAC